MSWSTHELILSETSGLVIFINRWILKVLSPPNQRRWKGFISQGRARSGLSVLFTLFLFSMFAEVWSNQRPLILVRDVPLAENSAETVRRTFFPVIVNYAAGEVGVFDSFVVDYKEMVGKDKEAGKNTFAIFPPNPWGPYFQSSVNLAPPSREHWLGTDNLGRDVTARLLYGIRVSLSYGFLFWLGSFFIGTVVGAIQGYFGGLADFLTERFKELGEIVPFLSVIILVNGLTHSQSFWVTLGVVVAFAWIGISSQMRAQFLALRKREFCEAARGLGGSHFRVIFIHILPNALTPILTFAPFTISGGISVLAVLDYLGFGLNPPTPSLGELLAQGRNYIEIAPWLLIAPTVALAVMLISINLVGESLRQAFDPKKS